jgi:hypothetical protein
MYEVAPEHYHDADAEVTLSRRRLTLPSPSRKMSPPTASFARDNFLRKPRSVISVAEEFWATKERAMTEENTESESAGGASDKSAELLALEERITAARTELSRLQEIVAEVHAEKEKMTVTLAQITEAATIAKAQQDAATLSAGAAAKYVDDSKSKFEEVSAIATRALAAGTKISDEQSVIATKSAHIEDAKTHSDKVRTELDNIVIVANSKSTEAEALRVRTSTAADAVTKLNDSSKAAKLEIDANAAAIKRALDSSTQDSQKTKSLADIATSTEQRLKSYEEELAHLHEMSQEKIKEINGLLPGATSAGLAHAFDARGKNFTEPSKLWQWVFVGSLILLVLIAGAGLVEVYAAGAKLDYSGILRLWLSRLPIAGALVWLALYASREAALAKRLEEDYAYKAAVSMSFQGFQQQMKAIQEEARPDTPVGKLCSDTLATIASPPGRIYDKHKLTISPSSELAEFIKTTVQAAIGKRPGE